MPGWFKPVEWLDKSTTSVDLEECQEWPADPGQDMTPHVYKCPSGRYFLDAGGQYFEITPIRAAILLLNWGKRLPGDLILVLKEDERTHSIQGEKLPLPTAKSSDGAVVLYGALDQPIVLDKPKEPLGPARYAVILTLVRANGKSLSKTNLAKMSRGSARTLLRKVADSDPDWDAVIHFPKSSRGGGYWIGRPVPRLSTGA